MACIVFLLVPWVRAIRATGCIPRSLADDITCLAFGDPREAKLVQGHSLTMRLLIAMGARVFALKCFLFSTNNLTRQRMVDFVWPITHRPVEVKTHFRLLGAHISVGERLFGGTFTDRLKQGITISKKLEHSACSYTDKPKITRTLILSLSLNGCDAAPASGSLLGQLIASMAKILQVLLPPL